jgi:hypothetical protein
MFLTELLLAKTAFFIGNHQLCPFFRGTTACSGGVTFDIFSSPDIYQVPGNINDLGLNENYASE